MAKGFKHGAGGGTALNFKVIGNPQPETAKANTIWVDTDNITSWIFSATQPETAEEGMVWISIGTFSTAEFNALKKNSVMVYPLSAKQCVNGEWVGKTAQVYQDGWSDLWNGELYKDGNEFEAITGGWIPYKTSFTDVTAVEPTITRNDDGSVKISVTNDTHGGSYVTKNPVSFKDKKTLVFTGSADGEATERCCIKVWSQLARNFDTYEVAVYKFPDTLDGTARLDVSGLAEGEYYVGICVYTTRRWVVMQEMRLE